MVCICNWSYTNTFCGSNMWTQETQSISYSKTVLWINSYAPKLVPIFYSAIKHWYRCFYLIALTKSNQVIFWSLFLIYFTKHIVQRETKKWYIYLYFMSFLWLAWFGIDVLVSVYYSLLWHATTLVSFIYTWSLLPTKLYWLLYSDWSTSYLIRALIPYHGYLLLLFNHVVKLCCVEGLMEDRCTSNKHSR